MSRHDKIKEEQVQLDNLDNSRPLEQPIVVKKAKKAKKTSFQNSTKETILIQWLRNSFYKHQTHRVYQKQNQ